MRSGSGSIWRPPSNGERGCNAAVAEGESPPAMIADSETGCRKAMSRIHKRADSPPAGPYGNLDDALEGVASTENASDLQRRAVCWTAEKVEHRRRSEEKKGSPGETDCCWWREARRCGRRRVRHSPQWARNNLCAGCRARGGAPGALGSAVPPALSCRTGSANKRDSAKERPHCNDGARDERPSQPVADDADRRHEDSGEQQRAPGNLTAQEERGRSPDPPRLPRGGVESADDGSPQGRSVRSRQRAELAVAGGASARRSAARVPRPRARCPRWMGA